MRSICYGFIPQVFGGSSPELVDYSQGSVLSRLPELCTLHPLVCRELARESQRLRQPAALVNRTRSDRHSPEPGHGGGELNEAFEVQGSAIIARCEAAEVLEPVEAAFDAVAVFVGGNVVRDDDLASSVRWNDRGGAHGGDRRTECVAVVSLVCEHGFGSLTFQQSGSLGDVANLTGRDDEAQRPAQRIGQHVDFGGQSASGAPQRLILGPPFPVAAC